jgi:hypothetical protein
MNDFLARGGTELLTEKLDSGKAKALSHRRITDVHREAGDV